MAEQDVFEFSAKYDVEIEKSSMDQACKVLDNFYNKYHDRKMKIDTSDMIKAARDGVSKIQKLYKQGMDDIAKDNIAWFDIEDGLDKQLKSSMKKFENFFNEAKIMFSDGSILSVLDDNLSDILSDKFSKGITATVASLEEPIQHIKSLIDGAMQYLEAFGNFKVNWDGTKQFTAFQEDMNTKSLSEHIKLLKELIMYQKQLELVSGELFKAKNAPLGNTTESIEKQINVLDRFLSNMERYNQKVEEQYQLTTNQFKRRQQILNTLQSSDWSDDQQARAIVDSERDGDYDSYIDIIKRHIDAKRDAIEQINELQSELFRIDNISEITSDAEEYISQYEKFIKQLEDKRDAKLNGAIDFTEVVSALNEIKNAIREIKDAFDPLTQAFANEDSAINKMVNANVEDLNRLQEKFEQVFNNIQTLSEKDFSSKTTNVVQQTINAPGGILKTQRAELKELAKMLAQYQSAIGDLNSKSNIFKKIGLSAAGQLDFFSFDLNEVLAGIKKSTTADKLDGWADVLDDYKKGIIKVANEINKIQSGLINLDPLQNQKKKDPDIINLSQTSSNVDGILTEVKSIRDQIDAEIQGIRTSFEDIFKFDSLSPNFDNIKSITDKIYEQFEELQNNIKKLDFKIEMSNMDGVAEAIKVIKQEGEIAENAAPKKDAFTAANQKLAESMKETGNAGSTAVEGIKKETDAVEEAYKSIANFSFKKNARVSDTDFETFAQQIADNKNLKVKQARATRGELDKLIGGSITFFDPKTLQEIQERYSVRPKEDTEDEVELYRSSYTLIENTAKAEQRAANEAERRKKAIADSNKWLIEQENLLTSQENKYKASSGAAKPLDGNTGLIDANAGVLPGVDKTIDGLANSIRTRINDAMGGVITQDLKNEIIKDLNTLKNEIQVQQARKYQSTTLRASSIETSRNVYKQYIDALEADSRKSGIYDQMSETLAALKDEVNSFTEDSFTTFLENVKKAQAKFKAEKSKYGQETQTQKQEEQDYNKLIQLQNKLYDAKKKLATQEYGSVGEQEWRRKVDEAQEEYEIAMQSVQAFDKKADAIKREMQLQSEVTAVINDRIQKEEELAWAQREQEENTRIAQETELAYQERANAIKAEAEAEKELAAARKESDAFYQQEDKTRKAQEDAAWAEYRAEQEAAAEKERQINLAFSAKEAQEAAEAEKELAQARKAANDYFDSVEKQEQKDEEIKKTQELNALYRERNTIITAIIKYNNKASTLKTDKAIQRAKDQLELEKQRLAAIDDEIDKYGELVNLSKLEQQNDRLTGRLRDSNVTNAITKEQKQDIEDVNHLLSRRKEVHDNILKLQKQLNDASGDEERKAIQKEIDGQNTIYRVLTKQLATYKDIALQRKVTEQDNAFREQDNWSKIQKNIDAAASVDKTEQEYQKQNYKDILSLVEQLFDAQTALHKINIDSTGKVHAAEREEEIKKVKELSMLLKDIYGIDVKNLSGSLDKNGLLIQEQKNKLLEKEREYKQEIIKLTTKASDQEATAQKKQQDKENKKNQNYGKLEFNQATKFFEKMNANVRNLGGADQISESLNALVQEYTEAYQKIASIRKQFEEDSNTVKDEGLKAKFQDAVLHANNLKQEMQGVFKETQKLESISSDLRLGDAISLDELDPGDIKSSMIAYANAVSDGAVEIKGFNEAGTEMYGVIDRGSGAINSFTVALDKGTNKLHAYTTATSSATNEWEDFKTQAVSGAKNIVGMYVGFQEAVQAVRTGVGYVKDIDLAMTELKKVTDETDESYKQFLNDAGSTSAIIGSTISDFTEASAIFARLGYSLEESSSMAETAIIYKNVADGLDTVEESSESIISTMMAFGIEANDTMSIIDRFNAVGNNFAITSAGIGEALQRSASALYSAGNTIDESVALVTAANSVIQNPEQVGTALKTLALRLRGAKTELEEAGLETDNMAESTSTLQAKLNALTHGKVDIMLDADTFKSTTQILREMSEAWEDMTDIERAAALELMGGKRQANILSSVIQNFETVEDVIKTSMNSSGSAMAENEKWLDSIEGKTYQFTNALQTMWSNMLDSSAIKGFLDFGTGAIQLLDTGAGKVIAFVSALQLAAKFKGFSIKGIAKGLGDTINKITTAQQTLQALSQTTQLGKGYDFTNVNAYAQAVANLTAKQQANLLASQGLNQEQIRYALTLNQVDDAAMREAMAHVHAASAKDQEAMSGNKLIQQKALEIAASLKVQAAKDGETRSTELNAAADILEQATSEELTKDKLVEIMTSKGISSATQAEILAKLGLTNANKGLAASIKALYVLNPVGFWITVGSTILSLIPIAGELVDAFTKSSEEIRQEADDISQAYSDVVNDINNNFKTLGITSDTSSITDLEKEFATLTAGVDRYGNNISLTSDEYERYKEICEQVVGINPRIASGYDSATEAIGNNAGVLSQLIELQKEQARIAAETYVNDENLETLSEDAVNDYNDARKKHGTNMVTKKNELFGMFDKGSTQETMEYILRTLGYTEAEVTNKIAEYYLSDVHDYDSFSFITDFIDEIGDNSSKFTGYTKDLDKFFVEYENTIATGEQSIKEAQDGLIDTLLVVPKSDKDYDKLSSESKNFLSDWINNSDMFKMDASTTAEDVQKMRDSILSMIDVLVSDAKNISYNGNQLSAQDILDQIYNFDTSSVSYDEYKSQIDSMLTAFWNSIGGEQNSYGFKTFDDFKISLGFNFEESDKALEEDKIQVANYLETSTDEVQEYLNNMSAAEIKAFYSIDWNNVDPNNINNWQDVMDEVRKQMQGSTLSIDTYSTLADGVSRYNDILAQTSEIVADNTKVTQEYKDSLKDLGITDNELNECFDKNNGLVVKNAALLRKLVNQKREERKATIQTAKAMSQLQYKNTVGQLQQVIKAMALEVKANGLVSDSTQNTIGVLRSQLTALQQTIQQYALLELQLTDAANAYSEFEAAKERDAQLTYGDSMVDALGVINEGFKNGQVGTEAFQAAVKIVVPESEYANIDNVEQKMIAIHDYIDKNPLFADWFTIDEGQFSITLDNINNFVDDANTAGIFTNDSSGDFFLTDAIKNAKDPLKELVNQFNEAFDTEVTEGSVLAMLTELEKYDASWGNIITDLTTTPLDRKINEATDALDKALTAQEEFILNGGDLNGQEYQDLCDAVDNANQALTKATENAENNAKTNTQVETVYAALLGKVKLTQEAADQLAKSLGLVGENGEVPITVNDDGSISITNTALQQLKEKKDALEKTSVMDIQLRYDTISTQIDELQKYVDENLNFEDSEIAVSFGIKNKDEAEAKIAELTAEQKTISLNYDITATTSDQQSGVIEQLSTWETNGVTISIGANTEDAKAVMEEFDKEMPEDKTAFVYADTEDADRELKVFDDKKLKDKEAIVDLPGIDLAIDNIETLADRLEKLPGKITITVTQSGDDLLNGTAHVNGSAYKGGSWGAPKTETALVGELGPEMLVRGNRWTTIGENGAEFTQIKKGDIIFNHKQTEDLLSKGYITGRGKAYASGTANKSGTAYYRTFDGYYGSGDVFENGSDKWKDPHSNLDNAADSLSKAADDISDSAEEFKEIFDWIEVRIEEITDDLDLKGAKLENAVGSSSQNSIIDAMIKTNEDLYDNLLAGANKYYNYASKLLEKVPAEYRDAAQNGAIAIEEFVGKVDEKTLEAIKEYREWVQKGDDLTQQAEETLTEIATLAKQAFDNIVAEFDNKTSIGDSKIDQLDAHNAYAETAVGSESTAIYEAMIKENNKNIAILEQQRNAMQAELNKRVESGEIEKYSQAWYDAVNEISAVDTEIIKLKTDTEDYKDAINELHWDHFDNLMGRFEAISEEAQNLIDLLGDKDVVDEAGNWTDAGITSLGLYAQQMENAEMQAKKYEEEINYLNKNWRALGYTEEEYIAKLGELKDGQYDAIKAYQDSKKAIVDLTKERVNAIKEGIEKEIEAYDELINKKKEELDAEKDLYDFQKNISGQQKTIFDLERQIAALSGDNSASARAKRAKLEAELAAERAKLNDMYYDRSVENQKKALDAESESFKKTKDEEIEGWDKYLEETEKVVADSLAVVQENTRAVYKTIDEMGKEYGLSISNSITSPWKDGEAAIQSFSEKFGLSMSSTVEELAKVSEKYKAFVDEIEGYGKNAVDQANKNAEAYQAADKKQSSSSSSGTSSTNKENSAGKESKTIRVGGKIHAGNAKIYDYVGDKSGSKQYYASDPIYKVLAINGNWVQVRHKSATSGATGWFKKSDIKAYASGTTGVLEDQLAIIDELGEELVIRPQNGKMTYMTKGSGVVPADLTENLMKWGAIDPSTMLERSKPQISASPSVVNNTSELKIDASVGTLLHVEHLDGSNPAEITKIVDKAWDKRMKELNGFVRKYSR